MQYMKTILSELAPQPIGPYSQAIEVGGFLYLSGQIAIDTQTGVLVGENIIGQTMRVLDNLMAILDEAGYGLNTVVKSEVFLADMADFSTFNSIYAEFFGNHSPVRQTIQAVLPLGALIEVSFIAYK
jgi:2-iminobutanoate/2-iminopropanoate deaminase